MKLIKLKITALFIFSITAAQAAQVVVSQPNQAVDVSLCVNDFTLINVVGARIVRGDGLSGMAITSDKDAIKETGNILIAPNTDKSFTYFVTDDKGRTWVIRATPKKGHACDSVVLKDVNEPSETVRPTDSPMLQKATDRDTVIKKTIQAMFNSLSPRDMTVSKTNDVISWWQESEFIQKAIYRGNGFIGKKYELKNISSNQMVLDEREFFIDGVIAVSIEKPIIEIGEMTRVFIVYEE